jgi:hypothetical protein
MFDKNYIFHRVFLIHRIQIPTEILLILSCIPAFDALGVFKTKIPNLYFCTLSDANVPQQNLGMGGSNYEGKGIPCFPS